MIETQVCHTGYHAVSVLTNIISVLCVVVLGAAELYTWLRPIYAHAYPGRQILIVEILKGNSRP